MNASPGEANTSIGTLLFDLDGVVRWFDKARVPQLEEQHGLPAGSLRGTAFAPALLELATTGQITRAEWIHRVGAAVGSPEAAAAWLNHRGNVDHEVIAIVRSLRSAGIITAILTNGTETVHDELTELGIHDEFDAVYTTADIGYAKPDPRAFQHVCDALGVAPSSVFFTDDTADKLQGAIRLGMDAYLYQDPQTLRRDLAGHGLLTGSL